jgi:hypothetical protein
MKTKLSPILASIIVILAILACNVPAGQSNAQPDLAATITAQAVALQALGSTPAPANTSLPGNTPQPADTSVPQSAPQPVDTKPAAPAKPKDLKADGSTTAITFSWTDNSLNETGFRLYQSGVSAPITDQGAHAATGGMSYNWSGLTCGFKGKFYVRAYNDAGESGSSNTIDGVTTPCQPTNFNGRGQGNAITFNWAVASNHNEAGFHIYQQGVSAPVASRGPNLGSGGTNYDMTGLACNIVATYYVTAFNSAGESPSSNLIQTETVPCGPSGLTITNITKDAVNYSWTDNATSETGFHVYQDDKLYTTLPAHNGTGTMSSDAAQFCDVNFAVNHVYSIKAFNYAGESNTSEHVGATTPVCP